MFLKWFKENNVHVDFMQQFLVVQMYLLIGRFDKLF